MDKHTRVKLRKSLKEFGLVDPPVWNRRTGNIVGGHQRLAVLDQLEESADYWLDVAVIDMDADKEKALNVVLNNPSVQGTFDLSGLAALNAEGIDFGDMGFDLVDVQWMFGAGAFSDEQETETAKSTMEDLAAIKARKVEARKELQSKDDADFYINVVFESAGEVNRFLRAMNLEAGMRYIDGRTLAHNLGLELDQTGQAVSASGSAAV